MKRSRPSGATLRKQRKAALIQLDRQKNSLRKFLLENGSVSGERGEPETDGFPPENSSGYHEAIERSESEDQLADAMNDEIVATGTIEGGNQLGDVRRFSQEIQLEHDHANTADDEIDDGGIDEDRLADVRPGSQRAHLEEFDVTSEIVDTHQESSGYEVGEIQKSFLADVGTWPDAIDQPTRTLLVSRGSSAVRNLDYDFGRTTRQDAKSKGTLRSLSREWFYRNLTNGEKVLREWLVYSPEKMALFCFPCKLFVVRSKSKFASREGFSSWWKLNPRIYTHEKSLSHVRAFLTWKEFEVRLSRGLTIDGNQQVAVANEVKKWKLVLSRILDIIKFLAKQNLALRGHREEFDCRTNRGNFLELVELLAKYDAVLSEHLTKIRSGQRCTVTYLSPQIQNEFIELMGTQVRARIIEQIKEAKYFTLILDGTPDTSHKDQTSQVIRYVVVDGTKVSIVESFIDFLETDGKNAEDLTNMILQKLESDGLDVQDCRGQAYDNAAVMAGHLSGVQKRIREVNPNARFVSCTNHSLNLAALHAASSSTNSLTFFGTVDRIFVFFSSSTYRWQSLKAASATVKRVIDTRWSARGDAVKALKAHLNEVLDVLEEMTSGHRDASTRCQASTLLHAMQSASFLSFLAMWSVVLKEINDTQNYLQLNGLNVQLCAIKISSLKVRLEADGGSIVNEALVFSEKICEELGIVQPERRIRRRRTLLGEQQDSEEPLSYREQVRQEMLTSVSRIVEEITKRFHQLDLLAQKFSILVPSNLLNESFDSDLTDHGTDIDAAEFYIERNRLRSFVESFGSFSETDREDPMTLLQFIHECRLETSVPNIVILLRIFLTLGVSVATAERSFSKLKLIKNYLRSTMGALRLSNLAILSIEYEMTEGMDFERIIHDFADRKARRVTMQ